MEGGLTPGEKREENGPQKGEKNRGGRRVI